MMKKTDHKKARQLYLLLYPQTIELLRLLAAPFETQIFCFPENEFPPDEIADEIEYKSYVADTLFTEKLITAAQYESVKQIDAKFTAFQSGDWTIEAMKKSSNWSDIREMAGEALGKFDVQYAKPNLYWHLVIADVK